MEGFVGWKKTQKTLNIVTTFIDGLPVDKIKKPINTPQNTYSSSSGIF
jgi:hypothetical protein